MLLVYVSVMYLHVSLIPIYFVCVSLGTVLPTRIQELKREWACNTCTSWAYNTYYTVHLLMFLHVTNARTHTPLELGLRCVLQCPVQELGARVPPKGMLPSNGV